MPRLKMSPPTNTMAAALPPTTRLVYLSGALPMVLLTPGPVETGPLSMPGELELSGLELSRSLNPG